MDIALLLLLHKALMGVQSQPPTAVQNGSTTCPPCPKPSSAIYTQSLQEVAKLRGLGMPVPIVAREPTTAQPVEGAVTFGEALTNLLYPEGWDASQVVVNISPEDQAAFREQQKIKQALR
jgi:hypothetical protein